MSDTSKITLKHLKDAMNKAKDYTDTELSTKANTTDIPSLDGYATETFVTNKIAEASLSGGEVDLSNYVTKDVGNANQITFSDGETIQAKLDNNSLKGEDGVGIASIVNYYRASSLSSGVTKGTSVATSTFSLAKNNVSSQSNREYGWPRFVYYDTNKNFLKVGGLSNEVNSVTVATIQSLAPSNAVYFRISINIPVRFHISNSYPFTQDKYGYSSDGSINTNELFTHINEYFTFDELAGATISWVYDTNNGPATDPGVTTHTITNNLTNCTNSNTDTSITDGSSYNATITANSGYELSSLTVTMGGADITSSAVSGSTISISNVTGNIVITANATEIAPGVVTYTVTNNLTNCKTNNASLSVKEGSSYNATITSDSGYALNSITVTMGGADITSSSVSDNVITISSVTGNIVITASAVVDTSDEQWTTTVQMITPSKRYLWNYVVINLTDGSTIETEPCVIGVYGDSGSSSSGSSSGSSSVSVFVNNNTYTPNNNIISLPNYITFPKGKKITILGDSITYGYDGTDASLVSKPYPLLVKELLGASSVYNYGMSGSTIGGGGSGTTYSGSTPMNIRYADMVDADYILVLGGVNDYCASAIPLGTKGDSTNQTFYGALKILIEGLINKYPSGRIGFMTPLRKQGDTTTNSHGSTLKEYRNAIIEMCEDYCIPVLDLYTKGGCHPQNATWRTNNLPDGLHPNQSYYEKLARQIASFILSL